MELVNKPGLVTGRTMKLPSQDRCRPGKKHVLLPSSLLTESPLPKPKRRGQMNKTEKAFAEMLDAWKRDWHCEELWFEAVKFRLADGSWYTPDFMVLAADKRTFVFYEIKGFRREASIVRLKVAASMYPFTFWLTSRGKGEWLTESVLNKEK